MVTRFNYSDGLKLLREQKEYFGKVVEHLHYAKIQITDTEEFLETHLTNYYFQLSSLALLISGTKVFSDNENKYFDLSSIFVLVRALIENYFCIHYLYFEPMNDEDLARYRFYLYNIHGLNIRQQMQKEMTPHPADKVKLQKEKLLLDKYIDLLKANSYFRKLHEKKQKQLLKDKPARDVSLTALVSKEYFKGDMFKQTWELLSNYAHTDYISALQLKMIFHNPTLLNQTPSLLRQPLFSIIMLNASMFFNLNKRFKAAEIIYEGLPTIFKKNNKMWFDISQEKN